MATDPSGIIAQLLGFGQQQQENQIQRQQVLNQTDTTQQNLQINAAKIAAAQAQQQQASLAQDNYYRDPSHENLVRYASAAPDKAEALYKGAQLLDTDAKQSQTNQNAVLFNLADKGSPDQLVSHLDGLITAEKSAGIDTSDAQGIRDELASGDPQRVAAARTAVAAHTRIQLAALGAKGFSIDPNAAEDADKGFTLNAGETRYNSKGQPIASAGPKTQEPFHYTLKDANGVDHEFLYNPGQQGGGGPASSGGVPSGGGGTFDPRQFFKDFTLPHEGGYAPHDANGAPVKYGVNQAANPDVDVKNLTQDQAADIFANKYAAKAANLPPALAAAYADTAYINPGRADQFLAQSGGDPQKFLQLRQQWQQNLVSSQPGKYQPYAKAWATRNADLQKYVSGIGGTPQSGGISGSQQLDSTPFASTAASPIPGDTSKSGQDYIASLPAGLGNRVQGILDGKIPYPPQSRKESQPILNAISQADPTFDATVWKRRNKTATDYAPGGDVGKQVLSIKTAINHLYDLAQKSDALGGVGNQTANRIGNYFASEFSTAGGDKLAAYNAALTPVTFEVPKALGGKAPAEGEVNQVRNDFSPNKGPSQRKEQIGTTIELFQGRLDPLLAGYKDAMGRDFDIDKSLPGSGVVAKSAALDYWRGHQDTPLPVVVTSPAQAKALKPGTLFATPDGRIKTR